MEAFVFWLFLLVVFGLLFKFLTRSSYKDTQFGFKGKLVYVDKGKKSHAFVDKQYNIIAKPDFMG